MKDKILVIGGYGQVGQHVCIELMKIFPERVFAGGRNIQKAISFSNETNRSVKPFKIDIYDTGSFHEILNDITLVIMCLSPHKSDFALYCIEIILTILIFHHLIKYLQKLNCLKIELLLLKQFVS